MTTIDQTKLQELIGKYKADFETNIPNELYKWKAVKCFQDNWDINAENFAEMLSRSLSKTGNLLATRSTFPRRMIKHYAKSYTEEVRNLFIVLFDDDRSLFERIEEFKKGIGSTNTIESHSAAKGLPKCLPDNLIYKFPSNCRTSVHF